MLIYMPLSCHFSLLLVDPISREQSLSKPFYLLSFLKVFLFAAAVSHHSSVPDQCNPFTTSLYMDHHPWVLRLSSSTVLLHITSIHIIILFMYSSQQTPKNSLHISTTFLFSTLSYTLFNNKLPIYLCALNAKGTQRYILLCIIHILLCQVNTHLHYFSMLSECNTYLYYLGRCCPQDAVSYSPSTQIICLDVQGARLIQLETNTCRRTESKFPKEHD